MFNKLSCKCKIVKNFSPSWFASVMWTWILAITSLFYSQYIPILKPISQLLFYFNILLFFFLLIPWILRWIFYTENAKKDLYHPIISNFYPTISVWLLVLAANFIVIDNNINIWWIFWGLGAFFTIIFALLVPFLSFKNTDIKIDHINPGWFIPPVWLIVIPIAWSMLIPYTSGILKEIIIITNFIWWWAGFFLYLGLLAICLYRFIIHYPLPTTLAPTIWINLWPIWAGTVALINLIKNYNFISLKEPFFTFWFFIWWFGIWWVLMAIIMTIYYIKDLKLPYSMSWWAFTFPLWAYVASTHLIYKIFNIQIIDYIWLVLYLLLFFLWSITIIKTLLKTYDWSIFEDIKNNKNSN